MFVVNSDVLKIMDLISIFQGLALVPKEISKHMLARIISLVGERVINFGQIALIALVAANSIDDGAMIRVRHIILREIKISVVGYLLVITLDLHAISPLYGHIVVHAYVIVCYVIIIV